MILKISHFINVENTLYLQNNPKEKIPQYEKKYKTFSRKNSS